MPYPTKRPPSPSILTSGFWAPTSDAVLTRDARYGSALDGTSRVPKSRVMPTSGTFWTQATVRSPRLEPIASISDGCSSRRARRLRDAGPRPSSKS